MHGSMFYDEKLVLTLDKLQKLFGALTASFNGVFLVRESRDFGFIGSEERRVGKEC